MSTAAGNQSPRRPVNYLAVASLLAAWIAFSYGAVLVADEFLWPRGLDLVFSAVALLSVAGYCFFVIRHGWRIIPLLLLSVVLQCGGCLSSFPLAKEGGSHAECRNHLRQIGLALQTYHKQEGAFPPAYVADSAGQSLYSWPVLILPQIEESYVYKMFHLDEPWDSAHNLTITERQLPVFQCPVRHGWGKTKNHISYVAIVGPETAWPGATGRPLSDFTDGPAKTILLLEVAAIDISWAEARIVDIEMLMELLHQKSKYAPSNRHRPPTIGALFADGSVRVLPADTPPATLRALLTVNGGEQVEIPVVQSRHNSL